MARSKFPHGFEPITKKLLDSQIVERLKALYESTARVVKKKTSEDSSPQLDEDSCLHEDLDAYRHLLDHLSSTSLLENTSGEIPIWLACCIANIFGILSPNVPTDDLDALKDILLFLIRQLDGLSRPNNGLYPRYLYLLECVSAFNIFDLALELGDDSSLILKELIKTSFNAVKEKQGNDDRSVQSLIIAQCSQLLQRIDQVTNPVIDAIFYFLVPPQKFVNRESYRMAREFILKNQSTLEPYIQMFLNHGISESELPDCNLITERSILLVIFELHEFVPEIIYPIFGSVVTKIKSEDVTVRKEIVKLLGLLFGSQRSRLAEHIPELWSAYMARFNDINEEVRLVCVNLSLNILIYHPELRGQVSGLLAARCHDINDGVRLESVTVIRKLALSKFEALNEELLNCLAGRIRDKKAKVRHEAIRAAAAIHKFVYVGEQFIESERASVGVLMMRILNFYYQPFLDDRLLIERLFVSDFVPFKVEVKKRMRILLDMFLRFGDIEIRSFEEIFSQQTRFRRFAREIFQTLEEKGESDAAVNSRIQVIAESYSTPSKIAVCLQKFVDVVAVDNRLLKLLKYVFGMDYQTGKVENALVEILQRLKDSKQLSEEVVSVSIGFLERYAPLQFDSNAVEELLSLIVSALKQEVSASGDKDAKKIIKILKLLQVVADNYSQFFSTERVMLLFERVMKYNNDLIETSVLKILSSTKYPETSSDDTVEEARDRLIAHFQNCARNGCPSAAKFAVRCIFKVCGKEGSKKILEDIVSDSVKCVDLTDPRCATAIKAVGACCNFIPLFVKENFGDLLVKNAAKVVLKKLENCNDSVESGASDKFGYYKIHYGNDIDDECLIRIFGMRLLCDFLMALSREQVEEDYLKDLVNRTLKMFERILQSHGELVSTKLSSDEFAGHIRLMAGCCIIKLASVPAFAALVTAEQLVLLGFLVHDELRFVRRRICGKLVKHLNNIRLPVEYMGLFALIPLVKEDAEFFTSGTMLLEGCILRRKKFVAKEKAESIDVSPYHKPEYAVAYGLYILAKQDSFLSADDSSSLREIRECLWFLISAFYRKCDVSSIAEILALLEHIKLLSDANAMDLSEEDRMEQNKKIWALADLGILMLSYRIPPFPAKTFFKLRLSKRFYTSGPSEKGRTYLPTEIIEEESKRTVKRKRNYSGSSTVKSKMVEKPKSTSGRGQKGKTSLKKRADDQQSEKDDEANIEEDGESEDVIVEKMNGVNGKRPRQLTPICEPVDHGLEEEAPSRSPSLSSGVEVIDEIGASTSHDVSSENHLKPVSAKNLLNQMNGISPILPSTVSNLKVNSKSRTRKGFLSSTPLTRCSVKKRIFEPDPNVDPLSEECGTPIQKKQKLSPRRKIKEIAEVNDSSPSGISPQKRPCRRLRQLQSASTSRNRASETSKKDNRTQDSEQEKEVKSPGSKGTAKSTKKKAMETKNLETKQKETEVSDRKIASKGSKKLFGKSTVIKKVEGNNKMEKEGESGAAESTKNVKSFSKRQNNSVSRRSNSNSSLSRSKKSGKGGEAQDEPSPSKSSTGGKKGSRATPRVRKEVKRNVHSKSTSKRKSPMKNVGKHSKTRSSANVAVGKPTKIARKCK